MNELPGTGTSPAPDLDLCEYVIVSAPSIHDLDPVAEALVELVGDGAIRLLDVAVLVRPAHGTTVLSHEAADVPALARLAVAPRGPTGLSQHDLDLAGVTLQPGSAAVLLLIEDRWAGALAAAAHDVGGKVVGGERIGSRRVQAQLEQADEPRPERPDLLARPPAADHLDPSGPSDPAEQIRTLSGLVGHGVLSLEQYEVQRRRVLDG